VADPARPRQLGDPLTGHTDAVASVAFIADGRTLATGSWDGTVDLWDVSIIDRLRRDAHAIACQRVGTGLNEDQWDRFASGIPYEKTC
jgi:WD40 repeat protein